MHTFALAKFQCKLSYSDEKEVVSGDKEDAKRHEGHICSLSLLGQWFHVCTHVKTYQLIHYMQFIYVNCNLIKLFRKKNYNTANQNLSSAAEVVLQEKLFALYLKCNI